MGVTSVQLLTPSPNENHTLSEFSLEMRPSSSLKSVTMTDVMILQRQ